MKRKIFITITAISTIAFLVYQVQSEKATGVHSLKPYETSDFGGSKNTGHSVQIIAGTSNDAPASGITDSVISITNISEEYKKQKAKFDQGDADAAYWLGVNLEKCFEAPTGKDDYTERLNKINALISDNYTIDDANDSIEMLDEQFRICEGLPQNSANDFFYYIKQSLIRGNLKAASHGVDLYKISKSLNPNLNDAEVVSKIQGYLDEYLPMVKVAADSSNVEAMLNISYYIIQSQRDYKDMFDGLPNSASSLAYLMAASRLREDENNREIEKRIAIAKEGMSIELIRQADLYSTKIINKN